MRECESSRLVVLDTTGGWSVVTNVNKQTNNKATPTHSVKLRDTGGVWCMHATSPHRHKRWCCCRAALFVFGWLSGELVLLPPSRLGERSQKTSGQDATAKVPAVPEKNHYIQMYLLPVHNLQYEIKQGIRPCRGARTTQPNTEQHFKGTKR